MEIRAGSTVTSPNGRKDFTRRQETGRQCKSTSCRSRKRTGRKRLHKNYDESRTQARRRNPLTLFIFGIITLDARYLRNILALSLTRTEGSDTRRRLPYQ